MISNKICLLTSLVNHSQKRNRQGGQQLDRVFPYYWASAIDVILTLHISTGTPFDVAWEWNLPIIISDVNVLSITSC